MVQLIAVAAIGGVAFVAYTSFRKHMKAIREKEQVVESKKNPKVLGDLEQDPKTGRYRVSGKDE